MKLGEIRISRATTNEPNEPSRAREISARRSPSRAGITLLVRWLRGGSARSYARLVWLVCDARRVCSARCQPCLQISLCRVQISGAHIRFLLLPAHSIELCVLELAWIIGSSGRVCRWLVHKYWDAFQFLVLRCFWNRPCAFLYLV